MGATDIATLRRVLPGTWRVLATTFPMWLNHKRQHPAFRYTLLHDDPLVLKDEVSYRTRDGAERHLTGTDRFDPVAGQFVWRGRGVLRVVASRWAVDYLSDDESLAIVTFGRSMFTPAGMDVIGRGLGDQPSAPARLGPAGTAIAAGQHPPLTWLRTDPEIGW